MFGYVGRRKWRSRSIDLVEEEAGIEEAVQQDTRDLPGN